MKSIVDFTNEIKAYFASKQALTSKVNTSDVVNNLTTTASGKVLDARQGKVLNDTLAKKVAVGSTGTTKSVSIGYDSDNWMYVSIKNQNDETRYLLYGAERGIILCDESWNPYWSLEPLHIGKVDNIAYVNTNSTTASKAYVKGEQFVLDGVLRKAKSAIANGATLTLNSNYENAENITTQLKKWTMNVSDMSQITPSSFQLPTGTPYINIDLTTAIPADASRVIVMMSFPGTVNVFMELLKGKSMNFNGFGSNWGCEIVWTGTKVHIGYGFNNEDAEKTVSSVIYYV